METRVVLALCVVLGSTLCGKALADSARRRANALKSLESGLRSLRVHMTSLCEPVRNALEHAGCPLLGAVAKGMEGGKSAGEAWRSVRRNALRRGGPADSMAEADARLLDGLFEQLGQSGREEQELLLKGALEEVCRLGAEAAKRVGEADRLYVSLGLLVGLMLALIVI